MLYSFEGKGKYNVQKMIKLFINQNESLINLLLG